MKALKIKYLGINLSKDVCYICLENHKALLRNLKILVSGKRYYVLDWKTLYY